MFDDSGNVTGNARFRGFCIDMLMVRLSEQWPRAKNSLIHHFIKHTNKIWRQTPTSPSSSAEVYKVEAESTETCSKWQWPPGWVISPYARSVLRDLTSNLKKQSTRVSIHKEFFILQELKEKIRENLSVGWITCWHNSQIIVIVSKVRASVGRHT